MWVLERCLWCFLWRLSGKACSRQSGSPRHPAGAGAGGCALGAEVHSSPFPTFAEVQGCFIFSFVRNGSSILFSFPRSVAQEPSSKFPTFLFYVACNQKNLLTNTGIWVVYNVLLSFAKLLGLSVHPSLFISSHFPFF